MRDFLRVKSDTVKCILLSNLHRRQDSINHTQNTRTHTAPFQHTKWLFVWFSWACGWSGPVPVLPCGQVWECSSKLIGRWGETLLLWPVRTPLVVWQWCQPCLVGWGLRSYVGQYCGTPSLTTDKLPNCVPAFDLKPSSQHYPCYKYFMYKWPLFAIRPFHTEQCFTVLCRIRSCRWTSAWAGSPGVYQTPPLASGGLWWRSAEHPASRRDPLMSLSRYCRNQVRIWHFWHKNFEKKNNYVGMKCYFEFLHESDWL